MSSEATLLILIPLTVKKGEVELLAITPHKTSTLK